MPNSAVKHVSGPSQPRIIQRKLANVLNLIRRDPQAIPTRVLVAAFLFVTCFLPGFATPSIVEAQSLRARIGVVSVEPARIRIEVEVPNPTNALSFRNNYAGVVGLGDRFENIQGIKAGAERLSFMKLAPGEFEAREKCARFKYEVNLAPPSRPAQMSHVSWINQEHGLLMLADLLPQFTGRSPTTLIALDVPTGWTVASNTKDEGSQFSTDDPDNAAFLIGLALHEKRQQLGATSFSFVTSGKWPLSDKDIIKIASKIIEEYSRVTQFDLKTNVVLMLLPYPGEVGPESWSAETRGNDVVLLLGRKANRKKVLSRLGIVLSHELFHLWVPNSLKLAGDYDWFFEGFTLYQALRMDLRLGLISFDDFLKTIASVYDSYLSSLDHDKLSLIEASERRWTTSSSLVYEKGMLAGFVYDLSLRKLSYCRASIDDVYRELFALPATGQRNANETIIGLMSRRDGLQSFARDYVESADRIDLDSVLSIYGIQLRRGSSGTNLTVRRDLSKEQRKLLKCIGS